MPNILFSISDTGGGHRAGATAIDAALHQIADSGVTTTIVDLLAGTGTPLLRRAPALYDRLSTRWLPFYDFLYRLTDGQRRMDLLTNIVFLQAHSNIVRIFQATRPDIVVSVHPLANRLIDNARRAAQLSFQFVIVVTDLVSLHAAWGDPDADLCLVPTDEAYRRMLRRGFPLEKLVRTGFPVHPRFASAIDQVAARQQLGLPTERFTVLLTSGGVGAGRMGETVTAVARAYPQQQLLVVTGKNARLRAELQALGLGEQVRIYGFVSNMEVLMAASDLVVTKAGPGTLMEALVSQRPVIVTEPVGEQEHGNIDFVLNHALGAYCPTPERVVAAIGELCQPAVYTATASRLAFAVPRDGATQIARLLLEGVGA